MDKKEQRLPIPHHIAIIMDGNGRWAQARGLERTQGHKAGAENLLKLCDCAFEMGVKVMTLYAFSTENWKRSPTEVMALMNLLTRFLDEQLVWLNKKQVQLNVIGQIEKLPYLVRRKLKKVISATAKNESGKLVLALSYGARDEITTAAKRLAQDVTAGRIKLDQIEEQMFAQYLFTADVPDPELMIRTSGEMRLSNFLLWQLAYTELFFIPDAFPDFTPEQLCAIIEKYQSRNRRFGK